MVFVALGIGRFAGSKWAFALALGEFGPWFHRVHASPRILGFCQHGFLVTWWLRVVLVAFPLVVLELGGWLWRVRHGEETIQFAFTLLGCCENEESCGVVLWCSGFGVILHAGCVE